MIKRNRLVKELADKSILYIKFRAFNRLSLCLFWFITIPIFYLLIAIYEAIKSFSGVSYEYIVQWKLAVRAIVVLFSRIERKAE